MSSKTSQVEPAFFQNAPRHLQAILRNERELTRWVRKENFERHRLAYRAIDRNIGESGGCILNVGLFSRTRGGHDQEMWQKDLVVRHLANKRGPYAWPYMSISTSPQKIVNFIEKRINQKEIVVIDMDMIDIMKVRYKKTTDLEDEFQFRDSPDRTWTSHTHYLVYEHIPQCCIQGFMSGEAFSALWSKKYKQAEQDGLHRGPEGFDWLTDLVCNEDLQDTSAFGQNPRFNLADSPLQGVATPPTTNGPFKRNICVLEDATLETDNSPSKRARPSSPQTTLSQGEKNEFPNTQRILWSRDGSRKS